MTEMTTVSAERASLLFVESMVHDSKQAWPEVRADLAIIVADALSTRPTLLDEHWTFHAIALARVGVEMQAVRNLLPASDANRVVDEIFNVLDDISRADRRNASLVRDLDERWTRATTRGVNPTGMIGLTLHDYLDLEELIQVNGEEVINPAVLVGLSSLPMRPGLGWWKQYLTTHTIDVSNNAI